MVGANVRFKLMSFQITDYIFCRDFLFLTSYKSQRYCQELEKLTESQARTRDVEERQYLELTDDEMDLWLKLTPSESKDLFEKEYKVTLWSDTF